MGSEALLKKHVIGCIHNSECVGHTVILVLRVNKEKKTKNNYNQLTN